MLSSGLAGKLKDWTGGWGDKEMPTLKQLMKVSSSLIALRGEPKQNF